MVVQTSRILQIGVAIMANLQMQKKTSILRNSILRIAALMHLTARRRLTRLVCIVVSRNKSGSPNKRIFEVTKGWML